MTCSCDGCAYGQKSGCLRGTILFSDDFPGLLNAGVRQMFRITKDHVPLISELSKTQACTGSAIIER